jgi:enolase
MHILTPTPRFNINGGSHAVSYMQEFLMILPTGAETLLKQCKMGKEASTITGKVIKKKYGQGWESALSPS